MSPRLLQVVYFLLPRLPAAHLEWALGHLNAPQRSLFLAMRPSDQAHAVRVAKRLAVDAPPAWVIEAALLHDCGKPAHYGLLARCAGVLLSPVAKYFPDSFSQKWLKVYLEHDQWSIEAAEAVQTSTPAIQLMKAAAKLDVHCSTEVAEWLDRFKSSDAHG